MTLKGNEHHIFYSCTLFIVCYAIPIVVVTVNPTYVPFFESAVSFMKEFERTFVLRYSPTSLPSTPTSPRHALGIIFTRFSTVISLLGPSTATILSGLLVRRAIRWRFRSIKMAVARPYDRASAG